MPAKEFRVMERNGEWLVVWRGCDGRVVCKCHSRYEAGEISAALNTTNAAQRWYKRATVALGLRGPARD